MKKTKILVCGPTGSIGPNIVERFQKCVEYDVVAVPHTRPLYNSGNIEWIKADLTCGRDVNDLVHGADVIIQVAATTSDYINIKR